MILVKLICFTCNVIQSHPEAKEFRFRPLHKFHELNEIFDGTVAQGTFLRASHPIEEVTPPSSSYSENPVEAIISTSLSNLDSQEESGDDSSISNKTINISRSSNYPPNLKRKRPSAGFAVATALQSLADTNRY